MKKFIITEEEKSRILEMHQSATSKQYLMEQEQTGDGRTQMLDKWKGKKIIGNSYLRTYDAQNTFKVSGPNYDIITFELYGDPMVVNKLQNCSHTRALYKYNLSNGTWYDSNDVERSGDLTPYSLFSVTPGTQQGEWVPSTAYMGNSANEVWNNLIIKNNNPFIKDMKFYLLGKKTTTTKP